VFSYDPAGQVLGGTVPVPGQPASVNTYAYDPEGNRTQSSTGIQPAPADPVTITGSTTYTANPLNQYTAITGNPNPTYDADGNLLSGLRSPLSVFTSTWNGENRMLSSTSANVAITDRRVENAYDALGRRVRKTVKFASTGAVIEDRYFIYDGWNVIEETIAPATGPVETAEAVWGTDLSGTAQGAGGVGGLLLRESSANGASYYHYDGNGNVTALTSGAGTVQAAYTYGPFGETLRAVGPFAQANPWRFSTKYQDDETGLLYYGYRFYNPTDGRWPSRDPIGEEGGINLSGFVWNDAVGRYDAFGLSDAAVMSGSAAAGAALGGGASAVLSGIAAAIGDAIPPVAATIAIGAGTGIGSVGLADGLIDITAPPRRPRPVPIGKGSRTRPRAIPIPIADVDKWKGCPPCKPHSRGTLGYQAHPVPPSSKHGPWPCHHGHYYRVNQVPWPVCKCFWNEDVTAGTPWPGGGQDETFPITDINNPAGSAKPGSIYFGGPRSVFPPLTP
jgi:RHS repeat-associated protein